MRAIFVSYRRDDAEGEAGRLFDDLVAQFGEDSVFMDVATIKVGRDFRKAIDDSVATCGVLLAVIGKEWIDAKNQAGQRRLDDPFDFVRLETASALKRDIPVVPVLVHGAKMPSADQLPDDLKELAYRNGVEVTHARWNSDVQLLFKALRPFVGESKDAPADPSTTVPPPVAEVKLQLPVEAKLPPAATESSPPPAKKHMGIILAALAAVLVVGAVGGYMMFASKKAREQQRAAAEQKALADKAAADKAAAEQQALADNTAAAKALADKAAADRAAAEAALAEERAVASKAAADKAAADRALAAKAAADRAAADRALAQQKLLADKAAAAKAAAEQQAALAKKSHPLGAHMMIFSDKDPALAIVPWGGAKVGAALGLSNKCRPNISDCLWTYRNGMILSDRDPTLAINAWNGARDGTELRLNGCAASNPDCTWTYRNGMLISNKDPSLAINATGSAHYGTQLHLYKNCPPANPDCTWTVGGNLPVAQASQVPPSKVPNFGGIWAEINPRDAAHPLRLKIVQSGSGIACYISYTQVFGERPFLEATINQGRATTSMSQGCAPKFQKAGYNYDNAGANIFNFSLRGSTLVYEQDSKWTSPCDGHPIGMEQNIRELQRVSQ